MCLTEISHFVITPSVNTVILIPDNDNLINCRYITHTEKRDAQQEIYSMQTKCSSMVRQAEQSAEEKLAKEKAQHKQLMEELGKQLAERQAKLKEMEESLALERASGKDTANVVVSKEVEAVPLLSHPVVPQESR